MCLEGAIALPRAEHGDLQFMLPSQASPLTSCRDAFFTSQSLGLLFGEVGMNNE